MKNDNDVLSKQDCNYIVDVYNSAIGQWTTLGLQNPVNSLFVYYDKDFIVIVSTSSITVSPHNPELKNYLLKNRNIITNNLVLEKLIKKYEKES